KMETWQWQTLEKNEKRQKRELYEIIKYSVNHIPYYNKIVRENNIQYSKESIFKDIKRFPILKKELIRQNFSNLVNSNLKCRYRKESSGGTTGEPIELLLDERNDHYRDAFTYLVHKWAKRGKVLVQLWGSEKDIFNTKKQDSIRGIIEVNENHYILNSFRMSQTDMINYINFINKIKPGMILAYVHSIFELTNFINTRKIEIHSPNAIITSAGTLFEKQRKAIQKTFSCPVFNFYGSREAPAIACECEKHEGLHLNIFNYYFEVLDDNGDEIRKEEEKGGIYITTLHNKVMPLIRYKIGDIVTFTNKTCTCGRGLPLIKHVNGRIVDIFRNENNELIDGEYFTHLFYFKSFLKQFQVIQKDLNFILVRIVPNNNENIFDKYRDEIFDIEKKIKLIMGENCSLEWKIEKEILPSLSGKFRYTISEI
ncbi:MAG: hypothetical protein ACFFDN_32645, partial [Candidatus Hodarchaeota archaeon]